MAGYYRDSVAGVNRRFLAVFGRMCAGWLSKTWSGARRRAEMSPEHDDAGAHYAVAPA